MAGCRYPAGGFVRDVPRRSFAEQHPVLVGLGILLGIAVVIACGTVFVTAGRAGRRRRGWARIAWGRPDARRRLSLPSVVVLAATGLGQTAAHHVADAQQHNVEPCPISLEIVSVPVGSP